MSSAQNIVTQQNMLCYNIENITTLEQQQPLNLDSLPFCGISVLDLQKAHVHGIIHASYDNFRVTWRGAADVFLARVL